ncbi:MAG: hypothetical protein WC319_08835 [Candidatus Paceibacterota bacterium]|jgi:hypothetical protein
MDNIVTINGKYHTWEDLIVERTAVEIAKSKFIALDKMSRDENLPIEKRRELSSLLSSLDLNINWGDIPKETLLELGLAMEDMRVEFFLPSYRQIKAELWEIILRFSEDPPKQKVTL